MRQRDIVWVRIPFSDLTRHKARPALVVSNDAYNGKSDDVVVCALTSNLKTGYFKVPIRPTDLEGGRLPLPSMVRADKVLQVEKGLIEHSIGRLGQATYELVVRRIEALIRAPAHRPRKPRAGRARR